MSATWSVAVDATGITRLGKMKKWTGTLTRAELALMTEAQVRMAYDEIMEIIEKEINASNSMDH